METLRKKSDYIRKAGPSYETISEAGSAPEFSHRTLKERMEAYAGKLYTNTEIDYGDPVGREL